MTHPAAVDDPDFEPDDEFDVEDFFPYAPVQQWVVLCDQVTAEQLAVLTFTMCHLNPATGRFDANFGRKRVAERFHKSLDWVDKQFKGLVAVGAMTRRHMYWTNTKSHTKRSPERIDPETGVKRAQAPNRWRVRMNPPAGQAHPGPVNIGEFYKPDKITDRLQKREEVAGERPPDEQRKPGKTAAQEGAARQRLGGAAVERPGGAAVQRPKLTERRTNTRRKTKERGACPPNPPKPAASAAGTNSGGDVAKGGTTDGDQRKSALHARARELAGPVAVAAVTADSSITETELAKVISQASPQLTQGQCVGRAATLLAWEHKQRRQRGDVTPGGEASQARTSPGNEPDLAGRLIS